MGAQQVLRGDDGRGTVPENGALISEAREASVNRGPHGGCDAFPVVTECGRSRACLLRLRLLQTVASLVQGTIAPSRNPIPLMRTNPLFLLSAIAATIPVEDHGRFRDARHPHETIAAAIPPEKSDVKSSSEAYARRFAGPVGAWFLDVQAGITRELLAPLPSPLRILDVGGGHAQLTPMLVDAGHEVTVLGSSPICGERLKPWTEDGRCRFEVGSLREFPYEDRSFDVALSFRMLTHVAEPEHFIAELCRVSRRSAILDFASSRSMNVLADRLFALKLRIEGNTRNFALFPPRSIEEMFERQRFRLAASRPQFLLPMAMYRLLGSATLARAFEAPGKLSGATRVLGSPVIVRADREHVLELHT